MTAFSRVDGEEKLYVQDQVEAKAEEVLRISKDGGKFVHLWTGEHGQGSWEEAWEGNREG